MFNISQFFGRVRSIQVKNELIKSAVQEAVKKHAKIILTPDNISFTSSALTLKGISQAARSEIFIRKAAILSEINAAQSLRRVSDIR